MIDRLLSLLTGAGDAPPDRDADGFELAVAALLVEAARMDDRFDAAERAVIERLLAKRFGLGHEAVAELVAAADHAVRRSTQYFPFTQRIRQRAGPAERVQIIEMLWKVAYADGALDPHEDALLRQIAGLIHVSDRERGDAKQRALGALAAARNEAGE